MNIIYHERDTNSTNTINKNEKENGSVRIPEVSKRKFSKKKKADNRKVIINRSNNNNGNDKD